MPDVFLRALQTYLKGEEWKNSIEIFVNANCKEFSSIEEMNHNQFALWRTFQEIVENILEMAMECAGGSVSSLEKELLAIVKNTKPRGPRDGRILDIIQRLLCFDDFYTFALMMNNAHNEQYEEVHNFSSKDVDISRKGKSKKSSSTPKSSSGKLQYDSKKIKKVENDPEYEARIQKMYEENYYALFQMGYTDEDLYAVMDVNPHDLSLDEWIVKLNAYIEEKNRSFYTTTAEMSDYSAGYTGKPSRGMSSDGEEKEGDEEEDDECESKCSEDMLTESRKEYFQEKEAEEEEEEEQEEEKEEEGEWEDPSGFQSRSASVKMKEPPVIQSFVRAAQISDAAEFNAKFSLAESIRDTFDSATSTDTSEALKKMIHWSSSMLTLRKDLDAAYRDGIPFQQYDAHSSKGLIDWYKELEASRKDIDESSLGGNLMSDAEIQKMMELDKIAGLGTEDEQYLHTLLTRHDTATRDIKKIYFNINVLVNTDRHITRRHIEQVYVYLKRQVANNNNLDDISDELYEYVSSRISSAKSGEVLTLLLDLHLLEDEEEMLKKKIQQIAGGEPEDQQLQHHQTPGGITADEAAAVTRMRLFSGDGADGSNADARAESKNGDGNDIDEKGQFKKFDAKFADGMATARGGDGLSMTADGKLPSGMTLLDAKGEKFSSMSSFSLGSQSIEYGSPHHNNNEALLNALKDKHKSSLFNLKNTLEAEKAKRLKDLEAKLAKRRQKVKEISAAGDLDPEAQSLLEQQQQEMLVISDQISETSNKYNGLIANMVSGYRKKCLAELKLAKKNLAAGSSGELSAEDMDGLNKDLSSQILSRFERDTQALLDRIEGDRVKARNKLLLKLAKKKVDVGESANDEDRKAVAKLERATAEAIEKLDKTNAEQVAQVLMESQTNVLNTLAALNLEDTVLINKTKGVKEEGEEEEEDDFYFDEETSNNNKLAAWLERMGTIQDNYLSASKQIQFKLNYVNNNSIQVQDEALMESLINGNAANAQQTIDHLESKTAAGEEGVDSTYSNVTSHMMKVVVDAYNQQVHTDEDLHNIGEGVLKGKSGRGESASSETEMRVNRAKAREADTSQVRAAIFSEFERTKEAYNNVMNVSKATSKQRLMDRRNQSRAAAAAASSGASTKVPSVSNAGPTASLLESVVDSFLENPLSTEVEYKEQVTAMVSPRSTSKGNMVHHHYRYANDLKDNTEDKDRIKALHTEREKVLEDDLYANMLAKKKKLEERLAKKRSEAEKVKQTLGEMTDGDDDAITAAAMKRQEQEARDKLVALEKAFATVQSMLQTASKDEMKQFDLKTLINLMEQKTNGHDISATLPSSASVKVTISSPSAGGAGLLTVREDEEMSDAIKAAAQAAPMSARSFSALPPVVVVNKEELEAQARRISYSYSEESQKQDLMMKIKETRQRQKLQRKLLEKKQSHAANLHDLV